MRVGMRLNLSGCANLKELPDGLAAGVLALWNCSSLKTLPENLVVVGDLYMNGCSAWDGIIPASARIGRIVTDDYPKGVTLAEWRAMEVGAGKPPAKPKDLRWYGDRHPGGLGYGDLYFGLNVLEHSINKDPIEIYVEAKDIWDDLGKVLAFETLPPAPAGRDILTTYGLCPEFLYCIDGSNGYQPDPGSEQDGWGIDKVRHYLESLGMTHNPGLDN
jgi:hypothetical protein